MSRIRSVHPTLFTDEAFMAASAFARVLLIGLWTEADDNGIFEWKPLTLKARLLPVDAVDINALLSELEQTGAIMRYETEGKLYGAAKNFTKYQRPQAHKSRFPMTEEVRLYVGISASSIVGVAEQYDTPTEILPQREEGGGNRKMERGREKAPAKPTPRSILETVLDSKTADAVLDHRKRKGAALGDRAAELLAGKLALFANPNAAADLMIVKGWQSIEPDWAERNGLKLAPNAGAAAGGAAALTTWVTDEDVRWPILAARYETEKGRRLSPISSKHAQGSGWHFPNEWLASVEVAA